MNLEKIIQDYKKDATAEINKANSVDELNLVKSHYLGKRSWLTNNLKQLKNLDTETRRVVAKDLNILKSTLEKMITKRQQKLLSNGIVGQDFDMSLPAKLTHSGYGHAHPSSQILTTVYRTFSELGFSIVDSNEIETDYYNFEALRIPPEHPARDMQDTFYIDNGKMNLLPRTHTSGMQIRFMEENTPPFKIIVPGRVYRNEDEDNTHAWIFSQVEGFVVGENVSMAQLKGTLLHVMRGVFGEDTKIRFRPNYFPYTEPSVEIDAWYNGKWLELLGAGMVHPEVLERGGINSEKYSAFAFGFGVERLAVVKYQLHDLRELWRPRFSYLEQF